MINRNGQPRVVRRVVKWSGKQNHVPKVARDYNLDLDVERIKANAPRQCASPDCPWPNPYGFSKSGVIDRGMEYARVTDRNTRPTRINRAMIYPTADYHFDCLPAHLYRVARLVYRYGWFSETCTGRDRPTELRKFSSEMAWRMWLRKQHPSMMTEDSFVLETNEMMQHGTGYYWSTLSRSKRRQPPALREEWV